MNNVILLLTAMLMISCGAGKNGQKSEAADKTVQSDRGVEYTILGKGEQGGSESESYVVVRNDAEFASVLENMHIETVPKVDFESRMAVIISMGQRNSGGYSIDVEFTLFKDKVLFIKTRKTSPKGMATTIMTAPYCIVEIPVAQDVVVKF